MEIDSYYVLCPYCKNKCGEPESFENDSWDDSSQDFECDACDKKFEGRRVITVDYRTEKDCDLNGEEHDPGQYHCNKCDDYDCVIKEKIRNSKHSSPGGKA